MVLLRCHDLRNAHFPALQSEGLEAVGRDGGDEGTMVVPRGQEPEHGEVDHS